MIKLLLSTYQYESHHYNLKCNFIQNLKNFEVLFKSNKIDIYEKVYKEGFIQKLLDIKPNYFRDKF